MAFPTSFQITRVSNRLAKLLMPSIIKYQVEGVLY